MRLDRQSTTEPKVSKHNSDRLCRHGHVCFLPFLRRFIRTRLDGADYAAPVLARSGKSRQPIRQGFPKLGFCKRAGRHADMAGRRAREGSAPSIKPGQRSGRILARHDAIAIPGTATKAGIRIDLADRPPSPAMRQVCRGTESFSPYQS